MGLSNGESFKQPQEHQVLDFTPPAKVPPVKPLEDTKKGDRS